LSDKIGATKEKSVRQDPDRTDATALLDRLLDRDVKEYTLRIYGLPATNPAIAAKIVWDYPFAYRAYEEAKQVLEVQAEVVYLDNKSRLGKLLRV
jgi:hypothetical protein